MRDETRPPEDAGEVVGDGLAGVSADDRRIVAAFVRDGAIPSFPANQSSQLVLWRNVVRTFEHGRDSPEPELNDLLRPLNPDVATIRRGLVDVGLLRREGGVYRRVDDVLPEDRIESRSGPGLSPPDAGTSGRALPSGSAVPRGTPVPRRLPTSES